MGEGHCVDARGIRTGDEVATEQGQISNQQVGVTAGGRQAGRSGDGAK